jgi:predicted secreted Zn-dependent protease
VTYPDSIRPTWRKSTASNISDCVEFAVVKGRVLLRHSKDPLGPALSFTVAEWNAFVAGVRNGEFDLDSPS